MSRRRYPAERAETHRERLFDLSVEVLQRNLEFEVSQRPYSDRARELSLALARLLKPTPRSPAAKRAGVQ